jgi:hypothetical protein
MTPGRLATAGVVYLAVLLAVDHFASFHEQLLLGVLTWTVLLVALPLFELERRVQALAVVVAATCGEVTGTIVWGVYSYRLHNLPLFIPPAHGLVFLTGVALSRTASARRHPTLLVGGAASIAVTWALAGLTVLPRKDVAGAAGVLLLVAFLWRSRSRAVYASVFLVVAALELYGTSIGTWKWAKELPGLGIPDGNPPSGVASGYVWFDVMALLLAPRLLALARLNRTPSTTDRKADPATTAREQPAAAAEEGI